MSSSPIEGTISAKPFAHAARYGSISGLPPLPAASFSAEPSDPSQNAIAELGTLISSLGTLCAQAQSLPLSPPSLPGLPQGGYKPQPTDYTQLCDDAN
jgi:hypothetical protein